MSEIPEQAISAAVEAVMKQRNLTSDGSRQWARRIVTAALEAAGPVIAAAERERIRAVIDPAQLRKLADWFDTDDEFKTTMFPETWPQRGHEVQDDLRAWADFLEQP